MGTNSLWNTKGLLKLQCKDDSLLWFVDHLEDMTR